MTDLAFTAEDWPLGQPFRFAGFTVVALEVIHVRLKSGAHQGQGEGVVPIVFGATMDQAKAQLAHAAAAMTAGQTADAACAALPPGAARNAFDCALWDLRAKSTGYPIWDLAGLAPGPAVLEVDQTIGIGTPDEMADAARNSPHRVLKIKADADLINERLRAIRLARPDAELIVDANQSWTPDLLRVHAPGLADLGVAMIEQPLRIGQDDALRGLVSPVPLFADESCHTRADLPGLVGLYQGINIKLDKTGGLTEALALARAARGLGMGVMVGCMAGTSLSMAPAFVIGAISDWSDLDGPLLLAGDRPAAMTYVDGALSQFTPALWG
jgi:L-alanine-DL-glutamate epimerase-like enolase superfamily enzyme